MIINDHHQFAFIHIPKCAGTTVRSFLQAYDDKDGAFTNRVETHPELGRIDYVHIPLFILNPFFPTEFESLQQYWSFAVLRDPFTRFASSVSQRLRMYTNQPIQQRPIKEIRQVLDDTIRYLLLQPSNRVLLPPEYIHFQKQVDYIYYNGRRIPDTLYSLDDLSTLFTDVNNHVGYNVFSQEADTHNRFANQTKVFRSDLLRFLIDKTRPATTRLRSSLPEKTKQRIRDRVYVPRDQRLTPIFETDYVKDFIRDFYSDDIELYETTRGIRNGLQ